jgi:hypothetical protein
VSSNIVRQSNKGRSGERHIDYEILMRLQSRNMEGKEPTERPRHKGEDSTQEDFREMEIKWVD